MTAEFAGFELPLLEGFPRGPRPWLAANEIRSHLREGATGPDQPARPRARIADSVIDDASSQQDDVKEQGPAWSSGPSSSRFVASSAGMYRILPNPVYLS